MHAIILSLALMMASTTPSPGEFVMRFTIPLRCLIAPALQCTILPIVV